MGSKTQPTTLADQEIIMKNIKISTVLITTFAITAPTVALADAAFHPGKGDAVYEPHQGYMEPGKTTSQVQKELLTFRSNNIGSETSGDATTHSDQGNSSSGKSRQEVLRELQSQSPEERRLANSN